MFSRGTSMSEDGVNRANPSLVPFGNDYETSRYLAWISLLFFNGAFLL